MNSRVPPVKPRFSHHSTNSPAVHLRLTKSLELSTTSPLGVEMGTFDTRPAPSSGMCWSHLSSSSLAFDGSFSFINQIFLSRW